MDFTLSSEHELVRQTAREFARDHLAPGVMERDEAARFPAEQVKMMGDLGFMGIMTPEAYGGAGMDALSYVIAMEEIARVDASAAVIMSVNNSLVIQIFLDWASDEQKAAYLPKLATGEWIGGFSLSEPQSGSDASNMRTYARKEGHEYVINGTKNWVTNGINSNLVILFCLTTKGIGYKGISAFIVEKGTPGFTTGEKEDKLGIRGSDTCELYFQDCRVPEANRIGQEGDGFRIAMHTLNGGRIGIAAQALGIAQAALDHSVSYAKERKQFGRTLAEFGAIQSKIARMATEVDASRLLVHRAAFLKDQHQTYIKEAAMAKLYASRTAMQAARECVQIHGGYGYMQEFGVERLMRDAKITQIYEGTSEIQELVIAREILKNS
ncbi:MAG: acyl-CoA dehydrogenase [Candidatus Neomarinimicrobiota bacterium]|nr:MAG: acyl-CoA dehydrogenase [Candidatus Neomarinimicrobiota bacterium]